MNIGLDKILEKGQQLLFLLFPVMLILNYKKGVGFCTILLVLLAIGNIYKNKKIIFTFYEKFLLIFIGAILISILFQDYHSMEGITHLKKHLRWLLYPTLIGQLNIKNKDIKILSFSLALGILGEFVRFVNEFLAVKAWANLPLKDFLLSPIPWNHKYILEYYYYFPQTSMMIGATLIMLYYLVNVVKDKKTKILLAIFLVIDIIIFLGLQSRGMSLALIVVILLLGVIGKKKIFKVAALGIIVASIIGGIYFSSSSYINRYKHVASDGSFHARVEVYKEAFRIFKNNKITGVGFDNFPFVQNTENYKYNSSYGHPHNMALKMLSETGAVGFSAYYLFMGSILLAFWKENKKNPYYLSGFLVVLTLLLYENVETMIIYRIGFRYVFFIVAIGLNHIYQSKLKNVQLEGE